MAKKEECASMSLRNWPKLEWQFHLGISCPFCSLEKGYRLGNLKHECREDHYDWSWSWWVNLKVLDQNNSWECSFEAKQYTSWQIPNGKEYQHMFVQVQRNMNHKGQGNLRNVLSWPLSKGILMMSTKSRKGLSLEFVFANLNNWRFHCHYECDKSQQWLITIAIVQNTPYPSKFHQLQERLDSQPR